MPRKTERKEFKVQINNMNKRAYNRHGRYIKNHEYDNRNDCCH